MVGVSLALGADAGYDRLQERELREALVAGMLDDLHRDSTTLAFMAQALPTVAAATSELASALRSEGVVDAVMLGTAIRESIYLPIGHKESATYREMTSTGALSLIIDPALRRQILEYYGSPAIGIPQELWDAWLGSMYFPYDEKLRQILGLSYGDIMSCDGGREAIARCVERTAPRIDLARMRGDGDLIGALVGVLAWTPVLQSAVEVQAAARNELVDALSR